MSVKPIPDGYHTITASLTVHNGDEAIAFYQKAFGAVLVVKLTMPDGSLAHAEMKIGNSHFMFGAENPDWGNKSPLTLGGTPSGLMIYVPDCDAAFEQAVAAGASVVQPLMDQFYGDRSGTVLDPSGHKWTLGTRKIDVPPSEYQQRMDDWMKSMVPA